MKRRFFTLLLLCLLPYFLGLNSVGLFEAEETRQALIAKEMFETGNWLVPRLSGVPILEKPPLTSWLVAGSFHLFGVQEWSARLLPLLCALFTVFFAVRLGALLGNKNAGWIAGILLATSPLFFGMGRLLSTDMLFSAAIAGSLYFLFAYSIKNSWYSALGFGLSLAASLLSKGPIGAFLLVFAVLALSWTQRSWKECKILFHPLSLLLAIGLSLPWFWLIAHQYPAFLDHYLHQHLGRFWEIDSSERDFHAEPLWYYLPVIFGVFLPWSAFLISAFLNARKSFLPNWDCKRTRALWFWVLLSFAFFSVCAGKRIPYLLPLLPALAVGVAIYLENWMVKKRNRPILFRNLALAMIALEMTLVFFLSHFDSRISMRSTMEQAQAWMETGRTLVLFPRYRPGPFYYSPLPVKVCGSPDELDFGLQLEPQTAGIFLSDPEFSALLYRPGSLVIVGPSDHLLSNLKRWDPTGKFQHAGENQKWMVVRN